ncbi:cysteine-rich receptor-like protein kinase 10 [Miscanthus floridulus]|uniref:cysteine-rich receptor-like protein kinase 10 n=1 Tax=Miscanthus floridulus TaxID=154761 RepID=UPI00345A85A5
MNPKISDFGMSRLFDRGSTQNMSKFYAPVGYSPPEYAYGGKVSAKTDIFSFGILLLEIATDKSNVSFSRTPQMDEFIDYVTQYTANKLNPSRLPPPDYVKDDCFSQFRSCIKTGLKRCRSPPVGVGDEDAGTERGLQGITEITLTDRLLE